MNSTPPRDSHAKILRTLSLFRHDSTFEIRALKCDASGNNATGFFNDPKSAADAVIRDILRPGLRPKGVYFTVNPCEISSVDPPQLGSIAHRRKGATAEMITRRKWMFVDFDPSRPADANSTDAELELARDAMNQCRDVLMEKHGWSEPIVACSGNGFHLHWPIDLQCDEEADRLVKRALEGIATFGSTAGVKVDTTVHDRPRICRLFGTVNRKGPHTAERPQRLAELLEVPDYLAGGWADPLPRGKLEAVALLAPDDAFAGLQIDGGRASHRGAAATNGHHIDSRRAKYVATLEPAVAGQGGHATAFSCVSRFVRGFDVRDEEAALRELQSWNSRCVPPWSDAELRHKISQAWQKGHDEVGGLLVDSRPERLPSGATQRQRLATGTLVRAKDRDNFGRVISDNGDSITVHFEGKAGQADVEFKASDLVLADGAPADPASQPIVKPVSIRELKRQYPTLRPAVAEGLFRRGEVVNLVSKSKVGKTWLTYDVALSVVTGGEMFGRFRCTPGRVLIIDYELHPENLANRIPQVVRAAGIDEEFEELVDAVSLRGRLMAIGDLHASLAAIDRGRYSLVILDALYRALPPGTSENDNAAIAQVYNTLDAYAALTDAAFLVVHHASKGDQSGKDVTDVGSGAGSQSRAADTHIILRPHEEESTVVVEAAVRSWKPVDPFCLRWEFPRWLPSDADPSQLKQAPTRQDERQSLSDRKAFEVIVAALRESEPLTAKQLREKTAFSYEKFSRLAALMVGDGRLITQEVKVRGNVTHEYFLAEHLKSGF